MSRVRGKTSTVWEIFVAAACGVVVGLLTLLAAEVYGSAAENSSLTGHFLVAGVCGVLAFGVAAWRTVRVASWHDGSRPESDGWGEGEL
jgi:sugar phosphate permease